MNSVLIFDNEKIANAALAKASRYESAQYKYIYVSVNCGATAIVKHMIVRISLFSILKILRINIMPIDMKKSAIRTIKS